MRGRDQKHAERLGAMLWAARLRCRNGAGARVALAASDSVTQKIAEGAAKHGITLRVTNGKILL